MTDFNYFKTTECNSLFNVWISNYPESFHPLDLDRFIDFVIVLLDNGEYLEYDQIQRSTNKLEEWQIDSYFDKYQTMRHMFEKLKNQGRIK